MALTRPQKTNWIEIITGQNNLNYLQSLIYTNKSPLCCFCEESNETFAHILNKCPTFNETRANIILTRDAKIEEWDIKDILKMANIPQIKLALSFENTEMSDDAEM